MSSGKRKPRLSPRTVKNLENVNQEFFKTCQGKADSPGRLSTTNVHNGRNSEIQKGIWLPLEAISNVRTSKKKRKSSNNSRSSVRNSVSNNARATQNNTNLGRPPTGIAHHKSVKVIRTNN